MSSYSYEAVDSSGLDVKGIIEVATQSQALRRIKEMGLFPTRVREQRPRSGRRRFPSLKPAARLVSGSAVNLRFGGGVRPRALMVFTRQLATLLEAGMPLVRGLQLLQRQADDRRLASVIGKVCAAIEGGKSFSEALAAHPKVFNSLYVNLIRAGEASGTLDVVLVRLAFFQEKFQRTKGRVIAAMFYPIAVLLVAVGILAALMVFVVPRFKEVFEGLLGGQTLPAFTLFVFNASDAVRHHAPLLVSGVLAVAGMLGAVVQTRPGRRLWDELKLRMPLLGNVFRKASVARFTRTLGTLLGNGVPVLQALTIARETATNVVVARVVAELREEVEQGERMAPTLKASRVFPVIVVGMVDIGEETGALPEMLLKIAENYDDEVDNAVAAMTSLIEPLMIILLAILVGSIVIALFLPLITFDPF